MEKTSKRNAFVIAIAVSVILLVIILIALFYKPPERNEGTSNDIRRFVEITHTRKVDSLKLIGAIDMAGNYFSEIILENGQFIYRTNLDSGVTVMPAYNTLRHAGAIYALCMYHTLTGNPQALATAKRAGRFLTDETIRQVDDNMDLLGVWTLPQIVHNNDPPELKLGGTGLGLVALCSLKKLDPGFVSLDTLSKMGNFILYMQKKNGSFYSKYYPGKTGRNDSWTSLYYPGEAALGLLMLYDIDHQKRWLEAASNAIDYLDQIRAGKDMVEADHWALLASELLLHHLNKNKNSTEVGNIITHAMTVCRSMINSRASFPKSSYYYGCFTPDGRSTPTSTRLEGLLSAITFIPLNDTTAVEYIFNTINDGIEFLLNAQVKEGPHAGAIPRGFIPEALIIKGVFSNQEKRATEIRIDYIQHALSAWIQYYNLIYRGS